MSEGALKKTVVIRMTTASSSTAAAEQRLMMAIFSRLRLAAALAFLCWAVGRRGAVGGVLARGGIWPLETWGGVAET